MLMQLRFWKNRSGFTLIELSLVLIITGLIISAIAQAYKNYSVQHQRDETFARIENIEDAFTEFKGHRQHYPCPAPFNSTDGREQRVAGACTSGGVDGVIEVNTGRDADGDGNPDAVLIGTVPYATLLDPDNDPATSYIAKYDPVTGNLIAPSDGGLFSVRLPTSSTIDAWGGRLVYAVTKNLTAQGTFKEGLGAIEVHDEHDASVIADPGTAHFVIISLGSNNRGAYSREGKLMVPCNLVVIPGPPPPGPPMLDETTNCRMVDSTFLSGLYNSGTDHYNDDILRFRVSNDSQLWAYTNARSAYNTNTGNVGVGLDNPSEKLTLSGDLKAVTLRAEHFCDRGGVDCLPPDVLGGADPDMICPPGQVIRAIGSNNVNNTSVNVGGTVVNYGCFAPFSPTFSVRGQTCPPGQVLKGVTSAGGGSLICVVKP